MEKKKRSLINPKVTDVVVANGISENDLLQLVASAEKVDSII